jgi:hypothetical protein
MIALVRTEFTKAARRMRTLVVVVLLIGLPTLIVTAIHARHGGEDTNGGPADGLFRLARQSGLLVPAAVLAVMSTFLLVVIAGMFAGDSVAGDAGWGNLRYLLMRPVARGRLLIAKVFVAGTLIWAVTILAALAGLGAGVALFGLHPVVLPSFTFADNGRTVGQFGIQRLSETVLLETLGSRPRTSRSASPRCLRSARSSRRSPTRRPARSARRSASTSSRRSSTRSPPSGGSVTASRRTTPGRGHRCSPHRVSRTR